jgi:hypothetical protein
MHEIWRAYFWVRSGIFHTSFKWIRIGFGGSDFETGIIRAVTACGHSGSGC